MLAFNDYINFDGANITMAADPFGEVAEQMGLLTDMGVLGMRCKRFAAIVKQGKIVNLFVDERGMDVSSAENCLKHL
jgi:peroxiredoxin